MRPRCYGDCVNPRTQLDSCRLSASRFLDINGTCSGNIAKESSSKLPQQIHSDAGRWPVRRFWRKNPFNAARRTDWAEVTAGGMRLFTRHITVLSAVCWSACWARNSCGSRIYKALRLSLFFLSYTTNLFVRVRCGACCSKTEGGLDELTFDVPASDDSKTQTRRYLCTTMTCVAPNCRWRRTYLRTERNCRERPKFS